MGSSTASTIFIVDDDLVHGRALEKLLTTNGFHARTFDSATTLWSRREELKNCDLIISDINMPGMSGFELCRSLRAETEFGRLPIILITGSDPNGDKAVGIEAGADDFVGKPFRSADLLAKIRQLLEIRAKEIATRQRMQRLQKFLSPNVANMMTLENFQPLLKPHRQEISVFFVDLRRFTAFSERSEPEQVLEVLSAYYHAVGTLAIKHRGTLAHLAGDGIMVFFNDPEPNPEHKETAILMAIESREALSTQREKWRKHQYDIDFGMGIAAGYATIGEIGFDRFSQYSAIGPVTNFAARLCEAAAGGQILVSQSFISDLKTPISRVENLGEIQVKGFSRPISICNISARA